jgi:hypothetical protein
MLHYLNTEVIEADPALFHRKVMDYVGLSGDWAEFGVWKGGKVPLYLSVLPDGALLHLFDSWVGLPHTSTATLERHTHGDYRLDSIPACCTVDPRCVAHSGWFCETVPPFADAHQGPLAFIEIDCDLYVSALEVLFCINSLIVPGTVICFDDFAMFEDIAGTEWDRPPGTPRGTAYKEGVHLIGEGFAFEDWIRAKGRAYTPIGRTKTTQYAVRIEV